MAAESSQQRSYNHPTDEDLSFHPKKQRPPLGGPGPWGPGTHPGAGKQWTGEQRAVNGERPTGPRAGSLEKDRYKSIVRQTGKIACKGQQEFLSEKWTGRRGEAADPSTSFKRTRLGEDHFKGGNRTSQSPAICSPNRRAGSEGAAFIARPAVEHRIARSRTCDEKESDSTFGVRRSCSE